MKLETLIFNSRYCYDIRLSTKLKDFYLIFNLDKRCILKKYKNL